VKLFSSKRRVAVAAAAILLVLFLARPGVSRLKVRIASSISRAVARPVQISSVSLRFIPPGFDLGNLVIEEDPTFGVEPMLRAPEVTAVVRLTSLLRGRLDVSRLELNEPSLNLVRRADGHWNMEELLERTERAPTAPTAKSKSEVRPGFPYIEASSGRINFKTGEEKTPYALLDADFALWQESENAWGMRLKAQPLRTDMNLNDAGMVQMNGTWRRATSLRDTPLQFSLQWARAPLGQLSKLFWGNDKGWRGEVRLDATLKGPPAAMQISADAAIEDFHRYDISSLGGTRLQTHCDATYSSAEQVAHEIFCSTPVGSGMITLHGDAGLPAVRRVNLSLDMDNIPLSAAAQLALRAKKNLPADLVATGSVQGEFVAREDAGSEQPAEFQGQGEISNLRLLSATSHVEFVPGTVPFVLVAGQESNSKNKSYSTDAFVKAANELHIEYGPFPVALGRARLAQARGWVGRTGYNLTIRGEGELSRTLRLASLAGLPAISADVQGDAQMDLLIAGAWKNSGSADLSDFSAPEVTGKAQLHNVRIAVHGVNEPIEILSAEMLLTPREARVDKLSARAGNAHWAGSVSLPRDCGTPGICVVNFNLNTDQLTLSGLHEWLRPPESERRWYQVLKSSDSPPAPFLQSLRANGKVSAGRMLVQSVVANGVSASLELNHGDLRISALRAGVLGGKYTGNWEVDFAAGSPVYTGTGNLTAISLTQVADAMHDAWISGTANASYRLKAFGADSAAFWKTAEGGLQFVVRDGVLSHIALNGDDPPMRVGRWQGYARVRDGKFEIDKGKLISGSDTYEISGTASLGRTLNIKLTQGSEAKSAGAGSVVYNITGTVAEPRVALVPQPQTQAKLKP
jgi:hypothetical protein